jgi:arylsulfatase A-like enzyme
VTRTLATAVVLFVAAGLTAAEPKKPNVLFIVADDYGYGDVGFHGCKDIPTPHLDALAKGGVRFTSGYVTQKNCAPTRAALLTGKYQQRFGFEHNPHGPQGLPLTETTIADRLKEAGYATGLIGKWHLGAGDKHHPQKRGFDDFYGFLDGGTSYTKTDELLRGTDKQPAPAYTTDAFGDEAVAFIDRHKAQPWFLYLAFNAVHVPLIAKDDELKKFAGIADKKRRTYAAMTACMDENVGKVLAHLKKLGVEKDTLVCFLSDNGGHTGVGATNTPLRGMKGHLLEGGVRVPFVVSWPGTLKASVRDQPALQIDLSATALAVAGVRVKPEWKLDGVNLLPLLKGETTDPPHDALYWRAYDQMAIRHGDHKLVVYEDGGKRIGPCLFNLKDDPAETNDLSAKSPDTVKQLQTKWDAWNKDNAKPLWGAKGDD